MTTDIPDWIAFFAIVGMEEFCLILKGIIVFIAYGVAVFAISYADTVGPTTKLSSFNMARS
jgi:hypothetical protein